jgi:hypothetical protein
MPAAGDSSDPGCESAALNEQGNQFYSCSILDKNDVKIKMKT